MRCPRRPRACPREVERACLAASKVGKVHELRSLDTGLHWSDVEARSVMPHLDLSSEITTESASFCGTVLPRAALALYGNEELVEQVVLTFEPKAQYECLLDAITAWLVPGLHSRVI